MVSANHASSNSALASKLYTHFQTWFIESIPVFRQSDQNSLNLYPTVPYDPNRFKSRIFSVNTQSSKN